MCGPGCCPAAVLLVCLALCKLTALAQTTPAAAAIVSTRQQLADAVTQGVIHIMLVEHVDLSGPGPDACFGNCEYTKLNVYQTQSIQVRSCSASRGLNAGGAILRVVAVNISCCLARCTESESVRLSWSSGNCWWEHDTQARRLINSAW
jgi:hypothetical protein